MNNSTARHAAGANTRIPALFIVICTLAMGAALMVGFALEAAPAEAGTSARYQRLWNDLPNRAKRWARQTAECESGRVRNIHGGGGAYHGAFQFMLSTWRNSPKSPGGDPHRKSFRTQAVVAVYLKRRDGARTHWPRCG